MSIQDNITNIESDVANFFEGLKSNAVPVVKSAIATGGKNLAYDAEAVLSVASAVAGTLSRIPGNVGTYAADAASFIPFAQSLFVFFQGNAATVAPPTPPAPPPSAN